MLLKMKGGAVRNKDMDLLRQQMFVVGRIVD
jgi:hypothetical protein